jgi:prepilin-type N-terminal cleavage/methylation domain-containing protein
MKNLKGFTLIELIVVIAIIAILAAIVMVNVVQYINKSKDSAAYADLSALTTQGGAYYSDTAKGNGQYNSFYSAATSPITTVAGCVGDAGFTVPCTALINAGYTSITVTCAGGACNAATTTNITGYCVMITNKANTNTHCVDNNGNVLDKASGTCASGVCG